MDELIDILNNKGERTGETCMKSYAHKNGIFHASAHIWIFNNEGEVLIQQRASNKDVFPNLWDISVAGHISAGEQPLTSAIREIEEEVGITVSGNQLVFLDTFKKKVEHSENLIDNELHYIYMCNLNYKLNKLKIQEEEVASIETLHINNLVQNIENNTLNFVPHGKDYFKLVFEAIQNFKK